MATGEFHMPEVRSIYLNDTHSMNDLLDLPSGLYLLRLSSKTEGRPGSGTYWFVIQIHMDNVNKMQIAKSTSTNILYLRHAGTNIGDWKSVTFS